MEEKKNEDKKRRKKRGSDRALRNIKNGNKKGAEKYKMRKGRIEKKEVERSSRKTLALLLEIKKTKNETQ